MKRRTQLRILLGIITLVLLIILLTTLFVEPWIAKKIGMALNEKNSGFIVKIDKVHILLIKSGIELDGILISSKKETEGGVYLNGEIESIKFKRIKFAKAIFKKNIDISEVIISNSRIKGNIPISAKAIPSILSPLNIRIGKILLDKTELAIKSTTTSQSYLVKEGVLIVTDLESNKQDTLNTSIAKQFDFAAEEVASVTSDSMYYYTARDIAYTSTSNTLAIKRFFILPNYADYDFTSRHKYQTSRIETGFSDIYFHDFSAEDYFRGKSLISSYVEIGKMDMKVFRDKRKEFRHVKKPAFQDMIYNYAGTINIDSIHLMKGNITYTEHAAKANEPGSISFNEISAKIYKITNKAIYKKERAYLEFKVEALLMGKGRLTVFLKGRIFDSDNTFSLSGTLSGMEANELNPILEKNAFIYATSGKVDAMNFSFTANNARATGKMTMRYHGLEITVKNKRTDDTTALGERFISFIANKKVFDSNPVPGKEVREGIIDYERDPEKFLFSYCFKSILSGIKSTLAKNPKKR